MGNVSNVIALRDHLGLTRDVDGVDEFALDRYLAAARGHVGRMAGFDLEDRFGAGDVPDELVQAVLMLAASWYLNREAVTDEGRPAEVPFGVREIVTGWRDWSF